MAREREVGTLWIGGALSWLEQLCLKSFVDQGQKITLFSYEDIPNVPGGVIRRDGREIYDTDDFIKYEKKDSFALFADLFRLHMIHQCPGMIWVDTDVYCHKPLDYDDDHVMGFELPGEQRINNAVLGLPAGSAILADMLVFTEDRFSIAPFLKPALQEDYRAARARGTPVHVSGQPWGVWGPMMVTHFMQAHGLADKVQPVDAFYPITFPDRLKFLRAERAAATRITDRTTALHLWASNKRELGMRHDGLPPPGSYLDLLVRRHGLTPAAAPIRGRGKRVFDAGLIEALGLDRADSFADLGGGAQALALAMQARFDCDIMLIDADRNGAFPPEQSDWIAPYVTALGAQGVPEDRIHVIRDAQYLRPADVVTALGGFGDRYKIKHIAPFLGRCLHAESCMILDARKGSGTLPFLRDFGTSQVLSTRNEDGAEITRILFHPDPPKVPAPVVDDGWDSIARGLAGGDGFYRPGAAGHSFLFIPRSDKVLVVTFDNLDITMTKREDRRPWGFKFIQEQGWSMLGVLAGGWTWYREPWVWAQFDDLRDSGFFKRFDRVVFYGASMGGYAAAAFSPAAPGADVVAISPQSTLDKTVVSWESRYKVAWDRDFSGPYGDAAKVSRTARRVTILYDPYEPLDAGHVARFTHGNVMRLRTPLLGHRLGSSLNQMGILSPVILGALSGDLTEAAFYRLLRARKTFPRYQRELFLRAVDHGHLDLARRLARHVLARGENRTLKRALETLG